MRSVPWRPRLRLPRARCAPPTTFRRTRPARSAIPTPGNFAVYSVTGTHQGVTAASACHGADGRRTRSRTSRSPARPQSHSDRQPGLQRLGLSHHHQRQFRRVQARHCEHQPPTLDTSPATRRSPPRYPLARPVTRRPRTWVCSRAQAPTAGDSRPHRLDASHPTSGDCSGCHTTTPTFATDVTAGKPANHIPTTAPCAQCHTSSGNYALYSVTGTHQGVTTCLNCHGPTVASSFANVTITTTPANHIPSVTWIAMAPAAIRRRMSIQVVSTSAPPTSIHRLSTPPDTPQSQPPLLPVRLVTRLPLSGHGCQRHLGRRLPALFRP